MRFVPSCFLAEGMILAKKIYNEAGQILLAEGVMLTEKYINRVKEIGYNGVYITDEISKGIEIDELISSEIRYKVVKNIKEAFVGIKKNKKPDETVGKIQLSVDQIVEEIMQNKTAIVNMIDLKIFDDYTFYHCVNVAVLSTIIGISLDLDRNQLTNLCLSALLHDIGKTFIPKNLLSKQERLTDEELELITSHSVKGFEYIKNFYNFPATTNAGILHHHERWDGSGYPNNKKEKEISLFGRIIAISDVYDALTSDRPYRKALPPSEAMEYIYGAGNTLFDMDIVREFARRVAPYPVGTCVELSNNTKGIVIENYEDCCIRPKIKVYALKSVKVEPFVVDLKNDFNYINTTIVAIVNI